MIDPQYGFIYPTSEDIANYTQSVNYPDFSAGLIGYSKNLYFGFAAHHLTQPNQGFISESQLPTKLTVHAGGKFPINKYNEKCYYYISKFFIPKATRLSQQFNMEYM